MSERPPEAGVEQPAASPFASAAPALIALGYSAIPISPDDKAPGTFSPGSWRPMGGWSRYCGTLPGPFEVALWSRWPGANVGVALGRGVLAFDIDLDDLIEPIAAVLPPAVVGKRGRKGVTLFFRGDTDAIRSRGFRRQVPGQDDPRRTEGLMDLIADGKQTVVPPSIHPVTGAPYVWTTERTLLDTPPAHLNVVTAAHVEAVIEVLRAHGYQPPEVIRPTSADGIVLGDSAEDVSAWFRKLNEDALANLDAWVPRLGLSRLQRSGDGYRSVAEWRPSSDGKPLGRRRFLLSIDPKGIVDYGDGEKGYTPLNLVMAAFDIGDLGRAAMWLREAVGYSRPTMTLNEGRKRLPTRAQAHALYGAGGDATGTSVWHGIDTRAREIWTAAVDPRSTPAEAYLTRRGLTMLDDVASTVLRFHPSARLGDSPETTAVLVAIISNVHSSQPQGIRCIPLDDTHDGKQSGEVSLGTSVEGAIKLDEDAHISLGLTIGQGVMNCMAWRQLGFRPTWAVCSPGNLSRFPLLPGVEGLTVLVSRHGAGGDRAAASECVERWHHAGRTTALAEPRIAGGMIEVLRRAS